VAEPGPGLTAPAGGEIRAGLYLRMSRARRIAGRVALVLVAASAFARFAPGFDAFAACFFAGVLVALATVDLERHILPNRILLPATAALTAAELIAAPGDGARRLIWAAGTFAVVLALALAYPAGLGMGDVKLAFFLGLGLGGSVILAFLLGTVAAGLFGLGVIARYGRAGGKVTLPLGPFLVGGALVALFALGPR